MPHVPKPDWVSPEWKPLAKWEYDQLPLFEQHRHCQILAMHFRRLAGPMLPGRSDQKPLNQARWDKYTPMAEQCEEEARRLGKHVHAAKVRQADARSPSGPGHVEFDLPFLRDAA